VAIAHALATKQSYVLYSHFEIAVNTNKKFITKFNSRVERRGFTISHSVVRN
jgi:hypothetical protein